MKVFLVEDSPPIIERLKNLLTAIPGVSVVGEAATAPAAIAAIPAQQPDLVLLDINLAEGSGFDVLRALQTSLPQVAVYVLSNFSDDPYRQLAARLGARGFFDKSKDMQGMLHLMKGEGSCPLSSN